MKPVYLTMEEIAVLKSLVLMAFQVSKKDEQLLTDLHAKLYTALTETQTNTEG